MPGTRASESVPNAPRESEWHYYASFAQAAVGIAHVRLEGGWFHVNQRLCEMLGYPSEELLKGNVQDITHPEDRDASLALMQEVVRGTRESYALEKRYLRRDGSILWAELNICLVRDERGNPSYLLGVIVDIGERKRIEEALKRANEELARRVEEKSGELDTLIRTANVAVLGMDVGGNVTVLNEAAEKLTGYSRSELVHRNWFEAIVPRSVYPEVWDVFQRLLATGEPKNFENMILTRSGEERYVVWQNSVVRDRGEVVGTISFGIDVTERKQKEKEWRELSAAIEHAPELFMLANADGVITYVNPGFEAATGYTRAEIVGKTPRVLKSGTHDQQFYRGLWETIERGEVWRDRVTNRRRDGSTYLEQKTIAPITDAGGAITGFVGIGRDITPEVELEAQLRRAQRLESLGTLAGGIAHDLNNVLTPILLGVESLGLEHPDPQTRVILDIIAKTARRGADIVRQVLGIARGVEGKRGEVQLRHVLHEIASIVQETFPKSIALKYEVTRALWPAMGDATQLHQVVMNLCVNARDAMPNGGTLLLGAGNVRLDEAYARMHVEARAIRYVVLHVEDTGTGMPPHIMEKIFDPFFTTKDPGKGTGLGLSMTRSIVKSHGGFITVASEPGKGSSFKVYVPAAEQEANVLEEVEGREALRGGEELILVVDDEAAVREITRQILESYGYQVLTAGDGTEALMKMAEKKGEICLMITDMVMPFMDGIATIRAVRKSSPAVRIIATSGLVAARYSEEASGLGVHAFLAKPYTAETLLLTLREVLDAPVDRV